MTHTIKKDTKQEADIEDSIKDARDYISEKADEYSKKFNETEKKLTNYTKSNPLKALGFAALLGYIISKIL